MKNESSEKAESLVKKGDDYYNRREFDKAIDHFDRSLSFYETIGDKEKISRIFLSLGAAHMLKGDVKKSLEYHQRCLKLFKELDTPWAPLGIGDALNNLGWTYRLKGDFTKSLEYYLKALSLREKLKKIPDIAESLINLVFISVDLHEREQAQEYLAKLKKISIQHSDEEMHRYTRLAEALFLKDGNTIKEKAKAQEILEELIVENPDSSSFAKFYLFEILFFELKMFGDPKTLVNMKKLVQGVQREARKEKSFLLAVKVLLLQAKLFMFEGDFKKAFKILDQAKVTAEDNDLGMMVATVMDEQKKISEDLDLYQELIDRNTTIQERIQKLKLEEYVEEAKKLLRMFK